MDLSLFSKMPENFASHMYRTVSLYQNPLATEQNDTQDSTLSPVCLKMFAQN